ncbi:hypothetical protein [Neisseria yangbaofengii]|uniref:hypothetical protein n=1 Tax=Neisseria yangbaofengii TaxID=2709396 RepID=UPI0013EAE0ED|nr:hypothetical protein [Neisseria yangbaofengii]
MNFKNKFKLTAAAICLLTATLIAACSSFKNQGDVNLQADYGWQYLILFSILQKTNHGGIKKNGWYSKSF